MAKNKLKFVKKAKKIKNKLKFVKKAKKIKNKIKANLFLQKYYTKDKK